MKNKGKGKKKKQRPSTAGSLAMKTLNKPESSQRTAKHHFRSTLCVDGGTSSVYEVIVAPDHARSRPPLKMAGSAEYSHRRKHSRVTVVNPKDGPYHCVCLTQFSGIPSSSLPAWPTDDHSRHSRCDWSFAVNIFNSRMSPTVLCNCYICMRFDGVLCLTITTDEQIAKTLACMAQSRQRHHVIRDN